MALKKTHVQKYVKNKVSPQVNQKKCTIKKENAAYRRKLKRSEVINYLQAELKTCSTHGLPYIVNTEIHWLQRLYWTICFSICCGIIVMLLSSQYNRFIETPTVMSVEMDYFNWNVSYPAFTLCPLFKPDFKANETNQQSESANGKQEIIKSICSSNIRNLEKIKLENPKGDNLSQVFIILNCLQAIAPKDYATLAAILFKSIASDALTTSNNWPMEVEPAMTELGMCHVVNSNVAKYDNPLQWNKNMSTPRYVRSNVLLSVHDRDFFAQIMNYADGYEIYIHSPDETILSTSPSYIQSDMGFLSFGVQVFTSKISDELRRFPSRIRKCRLIHEAISKRYPIYSYNHCMLECRIRMIQTVCGCVPHFYKPLASWSKCFRPGGLPRTVTNDRRLFDDSSGAIVCHLKHEEVCSLEQLKCVLKYSKEFTSFSASARTRRKFGNTKTVPSSPRDCGCLSSCETDNYSKDYESFVGQQEFSRLRIGISSFPKFRVVRDVIFSFYDIILRSGGVVNLCIGSSILSLVEAILVAFKVLILLVKCRH